MNTASAIQLFDIFSQWHLSISLHHSSLNISKVPASPWHKSSSHLATSQPPPSLIAIITGPGLQLTPYNLHPATRNSHVSPHSHQTPALSPCLQSWLAAANIVCKMCHGPDRGDQMLQTSAGCSQQLISSVIPPLCQHLGDRDPI